MMETNKIWLSALSVCACVWSVTAQQTNVPTPTPPAYAGPKIQFATPIYDFGKVKAGEIVKHDFIFTNVGSQTLVISNVVPSCGCTAAGEWTRQVEPGAIGSIPIQFNSLNFGGQVAKSVSLISNDKSQPSNYLQIKGVVWKPVEIIPSYAVLNVPPDSTNVSTKVRVVNNTEESMTIGQPEVNNPAFQVQVQTNVPGKEYQLTISMAGPTKPGNVQGQIKLSTSLTNIAPISITTWANVQPPVSILPAQVMLPAPHPNKLNPTVSLINNTTNPMAITETSVSIPGVEAIVKELQPGRHFAISLAFPPGFDLQNKPGELTVKSTNPKSPLIKVPILQIQARTPARQAAVNPTVRTSPLVPRAPASPPPSIPVAH